MLFVIFFFYLRSEETPEFYYQKGNFDQLRKCLNNIYKWNGGKSEGRVNEIMEKLKDSKENESSQV